MEEEFRGGRPQLFDFITNGRDWSDKGGYGAAEEKKLELRLGLPGGEDWSAAQEKREHPVESAVSRSHIAKIPKSTNMMSASSSSSSGAKRGCSDAVDRAAAAPVVGWPPIRSFRKNLAGTAKASAESPNRRRSKAEKKLENDRKGLFVKINMDGVPIGRKVDLKAYDSYEKLSLAVDELFRGLLIAGAPQTRLTCMAMAYNSRSSSSLAYPSTRLNRDSSCCALCIAQMDPLAAAAQSTKEKHVITGLLDRSGEYTLVYEDDEGDKMLVGDVPWE
ncbi:hypothetical protein BHE74_00037376 [Ensete ventricosum]|nr:hypothetical protein GW17_00005803 [Ensete ventricosum]RWW55943.1 hypothetical protein BHE74_00037376 [Ensete ventricosum]RZS09411.1 hypothetical protein BHM03_00040483 [Ensete ventricosum]